MANTRIFEYFQTSLRKAYSYFGLPRNHFGESLVPLDSLKEKASKSDNQMASQLLKELQESSDEDNKDDGRSSPKQSSNFEKDTAMKVKKNPPDNDTDTSEVVVIQKNTIAQKLKGVVSCTNALNSSSGKTPQEGNLLLQPSKYNTSHSESDIGLGNEENDNDDDDVDCLEPCISKPKEVDCVDFTTTQNSPSLGNVGGHTIQISANLAAENVNQIPGEFADHSSVSDNRLLVFVQKYVSEIITYAITRLQHENRMPDQHLDSSSCSENDCAAECDENIKPLVFAGRDSTSGMEKDFSVCTTQSQDTSSKHLQDPLSECIYEFTEHIFTDGKVNYKTF